MRTTITANLGTPMKSSQRRLHLAAFEALEDRRLMSRSLSIDPSPEPEPEPGPDPIEADVYEPNNSFSTASNLGAIVSTDIDSLTLHNTSDVDYYRFTAAGGATLGIQIDFSHLAGNLRLDLYNASNTTTPIASSNTSTNTRPFEAVTLTVPAGGGTYIVKVDGASSTVVSPDYSLRIQPLVASFDWSMPARFGTQRDQWGLPVVPNTAEYARPNPIQVGDHTYWSFDVRLDASGSFMGSSNVSYRWDFTSDIYSGTFNSSTPVYTGHLPEATYGMTLTATNLDTGAAMTTQQQVKVVDHLIVAVGDSYGAGEGNPNQGQQYDWAGFTSSGAKWAQGGDDAATAANRRAHRSSYAGVVQAALQLEQQDPKSSVTLVFLDHTGAEIPNLINTSQDTGEPGQPGSDAAQFSQMLTIVGNRRIDALVMSVGGNDAGFMDIGQQLIGADPDKDGSAYAGELQAAWDAAAAGRATLLARYDQLAAAVSQLNVGQVFLTEYPDPTHNSSGGTPSKILDDIVSGYEMDFNELTQVRSKVLVPLAQTMIFSAHKHGWSYVSNIAEAFSHAGYGDDNGFRTARYSIVAQGPLDNVNFVDWADKTKTTGTLHPTALGQQVYRDRIAASYFAPDLITTGFSLAPDAFLPNATGGYTLTVKNIGQYGAAPASVARIFISRDRSFDGSDYGVINVNIPALAPGQSATVSGILPVLADPLRSIGNVEYVGAILDVTNAVAESDEINIPGFGPAQGDIVSIKADKDLGINPGSGTPLANPTPVNVGDTINAKLGLDEFIGAWDADFYSFNATAGDQLAFDIDNAASSPTLRTGLRLYTIANGVPSFLPYAWSDNGRAPGEGSTENGESYLTFTVPSSGQYMIAVGNPMVSWMTDPLDLDYRQAGDQGTYTLSITRVPSTVAISGTGNADSIRLVRNGTQTECWLNGTLNRSFDAASINSLSIDALGGDDTIVLDYSNGNPLAANTTIESGAGANDTISFVGSTSADTVSFQTTSMTINGVNVIASNNEKYTFDGARGGALDNVAVGAGATATFPTTQRLDSVTINGTLISAPSASSGLGMVTRSLSIGANGKLDLNDNDLILDYSGNSPLSTIASLINSARANGAWTGASGITSSNARSNANHNTTLGAMEAADYKAIYGANAQFDNDPIDATAVLVKYTYSGDANFSGKVNFDDYVRIDTGYNAHRTGWANGDFNLDGRVNFDDYVLIDTAFNTQAGTLGRARSGLGR